MKYEYLTIPPAGEPITINPDGSLNVPLAPIIPFIEGDGIGVDITPVMRRVVDAAVAKAYGGARRIEWLEVLAGEKANRLTGSWFPDESLHALRQFVVSIKGPLATSTLPADSDFPSRWPARWLPRFGRVTNAMR